MENEEILKEVQRLEQEISERRERIIELMRRECAAPVEDYVLTGPGGTDVRLSELFGDMDDLIVVHNMGRGCAYCTLWADGFNGVTHHIEDRTAFVVASPDSPETQREFAESRGWRFGMVSVQGSSFTADMGFSTESDGQKYYLPGYSAFRRDHDGTIRRVGRDFFGPGDPYCSVFHMFEMLEGGTGDWEARLSYGAKQVPVTIGMHRAEAVA